MTTSGPVPDNLRRETESANKRDAARRPPPAAGRPGPAAIPPDAPPPKKNMTNPFHSFHIQKGGVPLKKLSKYYRNKTQKKTQKFQPITLQDKEDLVVPIDLLHIPPQNHCHVQHSEDYYTSPQIHPTNDGILEVVHIHVVPDTQTEQQYEHPPTIDDEIFEELFQHISVAPSMKKASKTIKITHHPKNPTKETKTKTNKNAKTSKRKRKE